MTLRLLILAAALSALACHGRHRVVPDDLEEGARAKSGVTHTVEKGQTLWRIARAYGVPVQELAEVNDLPDPTQIRAGQGLWVPRAERVLHVVPAGTPPVAPQPDRRPPAQTAGNAKQPPTAARDDDDDEAKAPKVEVRRNRFAWPVKGVLFSRFGVRDGTQHDGIDIAAPKGTAISAADGGEVLYAGTQNGYGNIVLVKHRDDLITIYAHNDENLVKTGDSVKSGQLLGKVGETGRASGPHLHFEVRQNRVPRNPLFFLPSLAP